MTSGLAAMALAAGTLLVATPAQAASTEGMLFSHPTNCERGTAAEVRHRIDSGYKVKINERCTYHKIGSGSPYWYSMITYWR
ncbi:hypothetical protein NBM05_13120 [Rothia sp. AR01]|uniref:Secreted protein n=1 Tax=Rothia santali TaxID=2949643 RepID=A0A9X2KII2_9MICC|nr:hypothetical protein [Rothia santali]MCP3426922.1 hypothetical protein [Rothia santali]